MSVRLIEPRSREKSWLQNIQVTGQRTEVLPIPLTDGRTTVWPIVVRRHAGTGHLAFRDRGSVRQRRTLMRIAGVAF
jgi:hypothetical protein